MLEKKIEELNKTIRDILVNKKFEIVDINFNAEKQEVTSNVKIENAEIRLCCDDSCMVWGYIKNVSLPLFSSKERKEITRYLFCECASIITEKNKQQIDSLQEAIKKLS